MDNVRWVQKKQYRESPLVALQRFGLPPVHEVMALRKTIWIGLVIRGNELRVEYFFKEGKVANSRWWQVCGEEFTRCGTNIEEVIVNANPLEIRKLFSKNHDARFTQSHGNRNHDARITMHGYRSYIINIMIHFWSQRLVVVVGLNARGTEETSAEPLNGH